jgi:putative endonuclease
VSGHNEGKDIFSFTYKRRLVTLKYFEHFTDVKQAIAREKQLKGWSRAKKEALFNEDLNLLKELSKARTRQAHTATLRRGSGDNQPHGRQFVIGASLQIISV